MAGSDKRKMEFMLLREEVGPFLSKLGQDMEKGEMRFGENAVDVNGYNSLQVSVKDEGDLDSVRVKIKVKFPKELAKVEYKNGIFIQEVVEGEDDGDTPGPGGIPKYKTLKKRMKSDFKAIKEALEAGQFPGLEVMRSFHHDSELMVEYPGKGDEFYPAYSKAVREFVAAVENQDLAKARDAANLLEELKEACHDRYK
ncbi:MAG: GAK system XXXCH domain-containing protein [Desulfovibrio sp.]|nr:MAG: GAK system XXXCH domain-containing protein [Desulfovibrio sp.]